MNTWKPGGFLVNVSPENTNIGCWAAGVAQLAALSVKVVSLAVLTVWSVQMASSMMTNNALSAQLTTTEPMMEFVLPAALSHPTVAFVTTTFQNVPSVQHPTSLTKTFPVFVLQVLLTTDPPA